ncbi:WhiB family transcriptional regulator [Nocardia altamirensis]|uniref:WhiB family transcriptional regulator n=1 Tax=Nocardia altamirensis TaxID=472158 RepID=UPI0009FC5B58|nr:WhiB family transcriptional regulator [Nocardia altamirensis]
MTSARGIYSSLTERWDWQLHGSCRGLDSSVFFSPDGERGWSRHARVRRAKSICGVCPVRDECRRFALSAREPYGIWGGMSEDERRRYWDRNRRRTAPGRAAPTS